MSVKTDQFLDVTINKPCVTATDTPPPDTAAKNVPEIRISKKVSEYTMIKIPFHQLINKDTKENIKLGKVTNYDILHDAFTRANRIINISQLFIRLYILHCTDKKEPIPIIDKVFIVLAYKAVSTPTICGAKPQGKNLITYNKLTSFYDETFSKLINQPKPDAVNLSSILAQS